MVQDQNDLAQLHPMAAAAQTALTSPTLPAWAKPKLQAVADTGYHEAQQLEKCEQAGLVTCKTARDGTAGQAPGGRAVYPKTDFAYDAEPDRYRCPAGQTLAFGYTAADHGEARRYYYTNGC